MSSREKILAAIANNKPSGQDLPLPDLSAAVCYNDVCHQFIGMLENIGAAVVYVSSHDALEEDLLAERLSGRRVACLLGRDDDDRRETLLSMTASELQDVETCYLMGRLGVAENGAVWVEERDMGNRLLPFICNRLVVLLSVDKLVSNMHQAYREIALGDMDFGVFIAGPSRTADIEQNLVVGAHGPARMTVYLV